MRLKDIMEEYYNGLALIPGFYHEWVTCIHVELGNDIYQFDDNGQLNMNRFSAAYNQVAEIIPLLFKKADDVIVVVNSYPSNGKKVTFPNVFKRYVKEQKLKYSLYLQELNWQFDEDVILVQQMELFCKVPDLKLELIVKSLINQDFHSLNPQLRKRRSTFPPDVFLLNVNTKCIFHVYDDRGCEIMNVNKDMHQELLDYFKDWGIQAKP